MTRQIHSAGPPRNDLRDRDAYAQAFADWDESDLDHLAGDGS
jgi:hypothetical protein